MKANINTEVYAVEELADGTHEIDLTQDFAELERVLTAVLDSWEAAQSRNRAYINADKYTAKGLIITAERLIRAAKRAEDYGKEWGA